MIVYLASNRVTGKAYVGKTKRSLEQRWREHCQAARSGGEQLLSRALRKHGPKTFLVTVLEECADEVELDERERWWVAKLGARGPRGYNLTDGGEGVRGLVHSPETRARMSEARKGDKNPNWGGLTDEHRRHISQAKMGTGTGPRLHMRGKPRSEETRRKIGLGAVRRKDAVRVSQLDNDSNVITTYDSMYGAYKATGARARGIKMCCEGRRENYVGFGWKFAEE